MFADELGKVPVGQVVGVGELEPRVGLSPERVFVTVGEGHGSLAVLRVYSDLLTGRAPGKVTLGRQSLGKDLSEEKRKPHEHYRASTIR